MGLGRLTSASLRPAKRAALVARVALAAASLILTGCNFTSDVVPGVSTSTTGGSSGATGGAIPTPTATFASDVTFNGATAAVDTNGEDVRVSWAPATGNVQHYVVYSVDDNLNKTPVILLPANATSYTVTGLSSGSIVNYEVNAFDSQNLPDSNSAIVTAMTYDGITGMTPNTGTTQLDLTFASLPSTALELDIFCQDGTTNGGAFFPVASINSASTLTYWPTSGSAPTTSTTTYAMSVQSGVNYTCKVYALSPFGTDDTNTRQLTAQVSSTPNYTSNIQLTNPTTGPTWYTQLNATFSAYSGGVSISCQPQGGSYAVVGTVAAGVTTFTIGTGAPVSNTALLPGMTYTCKALPIYNGSPYDPNPGSDPTASATTNTYSISTLTNATGQNQYTELLATFPQYTGSVAIQCQLNGGSFTTVATLASGTTSLTIGSGAPSSNVALNPGGTYGCKALPVVSGTPYDPTPSSDTILTAQTSTYGILTLTNATTSPAWYTQLTATFPAFSSSVSIECAFRGSSTFTTYATVTSGTTSLQIGTATPSSNVALLSGSTYTCKAVPWIGGSAWDPTPASDTLLSAQTFSYGYSNQPSQGYKGVQLVQALGASTGYIASTTPVNNSANPTVTIVWPKFFRSGTGAPSTPTYNVVRTLSGTTLDMTVTTPCTAATTTSCLACSSKSPQQCTDTNVASEDGPLAPVVYDYSITEIVNNNPEELPANDTPFRVTVQIPPDNMVLVLRDAVNYEMCYLLGQTPDPLNHQRCPYTGLGGTTPNTGLSTLSLSTSYFDFGYNFFIDRWGVGCGYNTAGSGAPSGSSNVYYSTSNATCYVNVGGAWTPLNGNPSVPSGDLALAATNQPGLPSAPVPPLINLDQDGAYAACQAIVDNNYGNKRLPRRREQLAAAAWPDTASDPLYMADTSIASVESGAATHGCNSNSGAGGTPVGWASGDEYAGSGVTWFMIGSDNTGACTSRYGVQDMVGNLGQWLSDQASCNSSTGCTGQASTLDSGTFGNVDLAGFQWNGTQGPLCQLWTIDNTGAGCGTNFSFPLGLSMVSNDGGNALAIGGTQIPAGRLHSDGFETDYQFGGTRGLVYGVGNSSYPFNQGGGGLNGRWAGSFGAGTNYAGQITFRCVLPTE
jgi:hypothetical protein